VLLRNSKYCSWEPGHFRQAGALAVITVAKLLRNSHANSTERGKKPIWWGGDDIYKEPERVTRSFMCWGFVGDVRFTPVGFMKEFSYDSSGCPCITQHRSGCNKGFFGVRPSIRKPKPSPIPIQVFSFLIRLRWRNNPPLPYR